MHDARSRSLQKILGEDEQINDNQPSDVSDKERQNVQAFSLRVELGDGRTVENFPWMDFGGYKLVDNEDGSEKLTVFFRQRALVIYGYNLRLRLREMDEGRRRRIKPNPEAEIKLALHSGEKDKELISRIECIPDFEKIISEIKGDDDDQHHHARRVAGR